jgi:mRNA interferase MazF
MVMQRGEIWWASLPEPDGAGPGYRRPVLVVQADEFNRSRIETVLAAVLTANVFLATAPGNVLVKARRSGLPKDSVVNVSQLVTLDKRLLTERVKALDDGGMSEVDAGLRLVLGQ